MRECVTTTIEHVGRRRRSPFHVPTLAHFKNLTHTSALVDILERPGADDFYYHSGQQSNKMFDDNAHRVRQSRELKRRADVHRLQSRGVDLEKIPECDPSVDATIVTLTLQIDSNSLPDMLLSPSSILWNTSLTDNLSSIMTDTNTTITCPDREDPDVDSRHQLSITGKLMDVEAARIRVQDLDVLQVSMPLVETRRDVPISCLENWLKKLTDEGTISYPRLIFQVLPPNMEPMFRVYSTIRVTGRVGDEASIEAALLTLKELIYQEDFVDKIPCSTLLFASSSQRFLLQGSGNEQIQTFSRLSSAHLSFPQHEDEAPPATLMYIIYGTAKGVILARKYMQAVLSVQLSFDVRDKQLTHSFENERPYKYYDPQSLVALRVLESELQSSTPVPNDPIVHHFCFTTQDYNLGSVYQILRRTLRGVNPENIPVRPTPKDIQGIVPYLSSPENLLDIESRTDPRSLDLYSLSTRSQSTAHSNRSFEKRNENVDPESGMDMSLDQGGSGVGRNDHSYLNDSGTALDSDSRRNVHTTKRAGFDRVHRGYAHGHRDHQYNRGRPNLVRYHRDGTVYQQQHYSYNGEKRQYNGDKRFGSRGTYNSSYQQSHGRTPFVAQHGYAGGTSCPKSALALKPRNQGHDHDERFYALNDSSDSMDRRPSYDGNRTYRSHKSYSGGVDAWSMYGYSHLSQLANKSKDSHYRSHQSTFRPPVLTREPALQPIETETNSAGDTTDSQAGNGSPTAAAMDVHTEEMPMSPTGDKLKRMNVLDLIKKAAEEPQLKISEDDDGEPRTPTYAEILLERKKSSTSPTPRGKNGTSETEGKPVEMKKCDELSGGDCEVRGEGVVASNPGPKSDASGGWSKNGTRDLSYQAEPVVNSGR